MIALNRRHDQLTNQYEDITIEMNHRASRSWCIRKVFTKRSKDHHLVWPPLIDGIERGELVHPKLWHYLHKVANITVEPKKSPTRWQF